MTTLQINGQSYCCPSDWTELKWSQFIALRRFDQCEEKPVRKGTGEPGKINITDDTGLWDEDVMVAKETELLSLFCGVEPEIAVRVDPADRKRFVTCLLRRFMNSDQTDYDQRTTHACNDDPFLSDLTTSDEQCEIRCGDEMIYFPESGQTFDGATIPLCDVSAVQWCEAADLYLTDKWEYAPLIVAVLCKGEEAGYIERVVKRRAEWMKELYMSTIFSLFLTLNRAHRKMKDLYPECYTKKSAAFYSFQNSPVFSWNELLLWAGHFRADEIEQLRSMNCYDFMALVNGRIKSGN
ncbi:MAG TPA: hypothetical protein IAA13_04230 [Candidatus Alistipes merdigallinarum]|nr:hypothetical protein [Candidatus Alistipes merdigallinarum]